MQSLTTSSSKRRLSRWQRKCVLVCVGVDESQWGSHNWRASTTLTLLKQLVFKHERLLWWWSSQNKSDKNTVTERLDWVTPDSKTKSSSCEAWKGLRGKLNDFNVVFRFDTRSSKWNLNTFNDSNLKTCNDSNLNTCIESNNASQSIARV